VDYLRCYFLDEYGRILGIKGFDGGTVSAAIEQGAELADQRARCDSIEIWRGGDRLYPDPTRAGTVVSLSHTRGRMKCNRR